MYFLPFLLLIQGISSYPQEFIAPVYELGSYIPSVRATGDIAPGKPSNLPTIDLENRLGENNQKPIVPPAYVLGSKVPISSIQPWRPSQIIPPGSPWPSVDVEKTTIRPQGFTTPVPITGVIAPGKPSNPSSIDLENRLGENNQKPIVPPAYVLGSKVPISSIQPWRPSQIIPPGTPWPSVDVEKTTIRPQTAGFTTQSIGDRFGENTQDKVTVLDYKPTRPSFHPNPGNNIQQIIPPGQPWPAGPFPTTKKPDSASTTFENRFGESNTSPSVSLEYKPNRPSFHPSPGNNIQQIIPNGEPWPARLTFNNNFEDRFSPYPESDTYANYYPHYTPDYPEPILVLDYKPNRPFYAGKPKE